MDPFRRAAFYELCEVLARRFFEQCLPTSDVTSCGGESCLILALLYQYATRVLKLFMP